MSVKQYNSSTISDIYTSRNNILELLEERGFDIEDYAGFSINEINVMTNNKQLDMFLKNEDGSKKIYVKYHYPFSTKIRPICCYDYVDELFNIEKVLTKNDDLIIITRDKPNDSLIKEMRKIYKTDNIYYNIYSIKNYLFNILKHSQVPSHRVLSEQEKQEIKKTYNIIKDSQFPEISRFDPVAQAIGLRPGNVCEIERSSQTAIKTLYYRFCI
jgi:DNA-directed RNA polymerase subunit H (RpoH/RPB5)